MRIRVTWLVLALMVIGAAARGQAPEAIQKVEISEDRAFIVNGKLFFPIFGWLQDAKNFPTLKACGMNATAGALARGAGGIVAYAEAARAAGLYGILPFDEKLKGNTAVLGYIHGDEPDLIKKGTAAPRKYPPEVMKEYQAIKAADPARPVFMTLTAHFMPQFMKPEENFLEALYPQYVKATDVAGFDVYPIYGWNKPEWIDRVYTGTKQLAELAGGRPVYAWIETSKGGQWTGALERQKDVTPAHIRAEVWMAICGGATGIGYFTHVWKPSYNQFGVPEENRKALREINDQITRLAPEILGARPARAVALEAEGGVKVAVLAKENGTRLSVFCVNYDERLKPAQARIKIDGLKAGTKVVVIDEGRTIKAEEGGFSDRFEPLAVHLYRVE